MSTTLINQDGTRVELPGRPPNSAMWLREGRLYRLTPVERDPSVWPEERITKWVGREVDRGI